MSENIGYGRDGGDAGQNVVGVSTAPLDARLVSVEGPIASAIWRALLPLVALCVPGAVVAQGASEDATRGIMIPRAAIVDMTRAQSRVICTSEPFLGCMGFDSKECLTLSESAIEQCLMPLPVEIDPSTLDNATLEVCPRELYEQAGYEEERAKVCFEKAMEADPDGEGAAER